MIRLGALLLSVLWIATAWATVNTYQDGVSGAVAPDLYISAFLPTTSFDGNSVIVGQFHDTRGLIDFNISDVGAGATISATTLLVQMDVVSSPTDGKMSRMVRADWIETEATYTIYKTSNNWTTANCDSDGNDYTSTGAVTYTAPTATGAYTYTGLGPLAQDALDNRSGHLILRFSQTTFGSGYCSFKSADNFGIADADKPKLTVTFTTGGGVGTRMRKLFGVGRRGPWWPDDYDPPFPTGPFIH